MFLWAVRKVFDPRFKVIGYDSKKYSELGIKAPSDMWSYYELIFKLIDRDGAIVDMGSGCGLLLKFIVDNSFFKLVPYGIDLCPNTIKEAQEKILPEYSGNFYVGDSLRYKFSRKFDFVLAKPAYVSDYEFKWFYNKCYNLLEEGGKLILVLNKEALNAVLKRKSVMNVIERRMKIISSRNSVYMFAIKGEKDGC